MESGVKSPNGMATSENSAPPPLDSGAYNLGA